MPPPRPRAQPSTSSVQRRALDGPWEKRRTILGAARAGAVGLASPARELRAVGKCCGQEEDPCGDKQNFDEGHDRMHGDLRLRAGHMALGHATLLGRNFHPALRTGTYHGATPVGVAPDRWVYDHAFYLLVNLAIGGGLGGPVLPIRRPRPLPHRLRSGVRGGLTAQLSVSPSSRPEKSKLPGSTIGPSKPRRPPPRLKPRPIPAATASASIEPSARSRPDTPMAMSTATSPRSAFSTPGTT